eukprot:1159500-Pelagomonas_calceolata.AAC.26
MHAPGTRIGMGPPAQRACSPALHPPGPLLRACSIEPSHRPRKPHTRMHAPGMRTSMGPPAQLLCSPALHPPGPLLRARSTEPSHRPRR